MAELKTAPNNKSVDDFLNQIEKEKKKQDSITLNALFKKITDENPVMWGDSIIGYGRYHYKYKSGREGDWFLGGFSPRKQSLTLYIMSGFSKYDELLSKLGKFKTSVACLYIKKLEDVDMKILEELISTSVEYLRNKKWS
ncbi:MAG: DUF1801 domain-containing protein [Cyclobacteriaceae bacterium]